MAFNILIVDDSETIRAIVAKTLTIAEVPVSELYQASNGKEALEILKKEWVDIVFADINMPVMDGVEMVTKIRENENLCEINIVVISTEGSSTRIQELQDKGINAYIRKPFTPEQLSSVIKEILGDWNESELQ